VVLRLRGAAEAFPPPGFSALPLLLVAGAIAGRLAGVAGRWGMRRFGSYAAESRRRGRTACGEGLYSIHGAAILATGLRGFTMPADALGVLSVVCCRLSLVVTTAPTASNDVHAHCSGQPSRTREPSRRDPRPTTHDPPHSSTPVLPPAGQASRRRAPTHRESPTEANVMVDGRVVRRMHLLCFCIFVLLPTKLRQSARSAGCMRAPGITPSTAERAV
jgi:hypothetical protein